MQKSERKDRLPDMEGFYEVKADQKDYHLFYCKKPDCKPHFHSSNELLFVAKGEVQVLVEGKMRILQAGDACFVDAFQIHTYQSYPQNSETTAYSIVGAKGFFDDFFIACGNQSPITFFRFDHYDLLETMYAIYSNVKEKELKTITFSAVVRLLLSDLFLTVPFTAKEQTPQNQVICKLLQYVEEHLEADLSLHSVAEHLNYSGAYLSRLVKKYMNEGWCNYVNGQRAERARKMIAEHPDQMIADVASTCGFDSVKTFYRVYKKHFGEPPKRKKVKK